MENRGCRVNGQRQRRKTESRGPRWIEKWASSSGEKGGGGKGRRWPGLLKIEGSGRVRVEMRIASATDRRGRICEWSGKETERVK